MEVLLGVSMDTDMLLPRPPHSRVLIVGASARAAAESAANAGFDVVALDTFADLDQHPAVQMPISHPEGAPCGAGSAARLAMSLRADAAVYLSGFENHPRSVARLARGRRLWGNPPSVLRQVRDPFVVADCLRARGFSLPALLRAQDAGKADAAARWLVKPIASGGGRRVRAWDANLAPTSVSSPMRRTLGHAPRVVPGDCYLQAFVEGTPGSLAFVAAGGGVVPIGLSRQLVGERAFGASGYRYCGSILAPLPLQHGADAHNTLLARATALAGALAQAFGLVGVNGIDFIARDDVPHLIEVNPRWCASMELVERAYGLSVFAAHADACVSRRLPAFDVAKAAAGTPVLGKAVGKAVGKAIVFATSGVTVGDSRLWLGDANVRDVPRPGTRIRARQPICTVFASAADDAACHAALVQRADDIYARVAAWRRRAA